jgi:membrane protein implicated in regulation of membrane protease activity
MDRLPVSPSWRKPAGIFLILSLILAWSVAVATLADRFAGWPWPLEALFFLVAGLAWILPLRPLVRWMQTGKWRE